jgi:ribosomal protein L7/L12
MNAMELNIPPTELDRIKAAIFGGRKIEAIKICRQATGLGLAEAKTVIDTMETELRKTDADKFTASAKGCFGVIVLFVGAAAGFGVLLAYA